MRVTANTFPNSLLQQLNSLNQRQNKLQNQAATGQRVQLPEDDPVAMRRVLDLQAEGKSTGQYQRNISRLQELAVASFNSIKALKGVSDRTREISISADGLKSQDELNIYANEVTELIKQAVQTVNAKNRGDYLFSGTLSDQVPFVLATDASGNVTSVTYQGNTTLAESEIASGELVRIPVRELDLNRKLRLVYPKKANLSHATQAFLRVAEAYATERGGNYRYQRK